MTMHHEVMILVLFVLFKFMFHSEGEVGRLLNRFKPPPPPPYILITDRFKAVHLIRFFEFACFGVSFWTVFLLLKIANFQYFPLAPFARSIGSLMKL